MLTTDVENPQAIVCLLQQQRYHAVVGNPPYINVQDSALRSMYRELYESCSGTYQVSVPFTELFFRAADQDGYVGMITSNAFMKRSFGKKLVEDCLPRWDLTHVIDTSGVYLPGHGTPTAILIGRKRAPLSAALRVVRGIRGETHAPENPQTAPVWTAIVAQVDQPESQSRWVSVADARREAFHSHPWAIGGGGAAELKGRLDEMGRDNLASKSAIIGRGMHTGCDDAYFYPRSAPKRLGIDPQHTIALVTGECIRHWAVQPDTVAIYPYDEDNSARLVEPLKHILWPYRPVLGQRREPGGTHAEIGLTWYEWSRFHPERISSDPCLTFAFVSIGNQFAFDCHSRTFKQSAPMIRVLGLTATQHVELLGILNSSTACFWLNQVCFIKGDGTRGLEAHRWMFSLEYDSTKVGQLPLPADRPTELATAIQAAADERTKLLPANLIQSGTPTRERLDTARHRAAALLRRMIALQEELDWHVYHLYGLNEESLTLPIDQVPDIELGQRAFEIVMARDPELETAWFERHGSTPITQIPAHWPEPYRNLVQRRLDRIAADRDIALIEQPEYKRRWNLPKWDSLEQDALRSWLLDRLEAETIWNREDPELLSVERLSDRIRHDTDFRSVAALYAAREDYDLTALVQELAANEAVPFLPVLRYKEPGLRKREQWERTWDLQRREDRGENVGDIPVPPKYKPEDFLPGPSWRLRGKLDVPKERFILYPGLERDTDRTAVIAWAGFDHGEQARALAGYYQQMRADEGWQCDRLLPILAGLAELQPWLKQWHPDVAPLIDEFLRGELAEWSITEQQLKEWRPPQTTRARRTSSRRAAGSNTRT
jgi:hypothetical protein